MKKTEGRHTLIPTGMEAQEQDWRMSPGLVSGNQVFVTGFSGCPVDGTPPRDPEAQMRIAFDAVAEVLAEAGLDWGSVVDMTSYHVGLRDHLALFKSVHAEYVRRPYPAWTAIEVAGFATPGVIVEIKVVAHLPNGHVS